MKITLKKTFLKDMAKLEEPFKTRVKTFIENLYSDPEYLETTAHHIKKIKGAGKPLFTGSGSVIIVWAMKGREMRSSCTAFSTEERLTVIFHNNEMPYMQLRNESDTSF